MSDSNQLERRLREAARTIDYPPTPDIAGALGRGQRPVGAPLRQRVGLAALLAALLLAALLLAVPEARAAALRLLQIGTVRVRVEPAPAPVVATPPAPAPIPTRTITAPTPADLGLAGETSLAAAARRLTFPILLPAYPPDLGPPDRVFLQDLDGAALVLVWLDPDNPARPRLSLHALSSFTFVEKTLYGEETELLAEVQVGGAPALWVRGPHVIQSSRRGGGLDVRRLVPGDTLIWTRDDRTYRLETTLPLAEALLVAESLTALPGGE